MTYLITLLPLIGSLFFLPINEDSGNARNHSIIKQIGLSTSLVVLILSIYLLSKSAILFPFFPTWYTNLSEGGIELGTLSLSNINNLEGVDFGNLNTSSISQLESVDSISLYFILLTAFITPICLLSNWNDITFKRKYFVFSFLLLETLQMSFFLVSDLLLFYIYFESVLIPLFIIVGIWGSSPQRIRAAFLIFLYTLAGSLPMLLAILFIQSNLGATDFNYFTLYELSPETQTWLGFAFLLSFAVKSPTYPFHLWLLKAHVEAPLAGSVLLAAIILKFATYGFIRIVLTLCPDFTHHNIYIIQSLSIITLIYSSLVSIRQIDLKALVAYSSIAHMAVCILSIFSNTVAGIEGGILLSLGHGFVSSALFILVGGVLYNRYHTRNINYYRGITVKMPLFALVFFIFTIFNAGAPLSLNFVGEFMSLTGIFMQSPILGVIASSSIVFSAIYSIFFFNRISFLGFSPYLKKEIILKGKNLNQSDLTRSELAILLPLLIASIIFGLFPNLILESLHFDVSNLLYNNSISETDPSFISGSTSAKNLIVGSLITSTGVNPVKENYLKLKNKHKDFLKWLSGFVAGEGSFYIARGLSSFTFQILLHIDDINVLYKIQNFLSKLAGKTVGSIVKYPKTYEAKLVIGEFNILVNLIIPILRDFPLLGTKNLDFSDWAKAVELKANSPIIRSESLTGGESYLVSPENLDKIQEIKNSMNSNRSHLDQDILNTQTNDISPEATVGFTEGEGSFILDQDRKYAPRFSITQNTASAIILVKISKLLLALPFKVPSYLILTEDALSKAQNSSTVGSKRREEKDYITDSKTSAVSQLKLSDIIFLTFHLLPFFESQVFLSRKFFDFKIWWITVLLRIADYHLIPQGLLIISRLANNMNQRRYSNYHLSKNYNPDIPKLSLPSIQEINNLTQEFKPNPDITIMPFPINFFDEETVEIPQADTKTYWVYDHLTGSPLLVEGSPFASLTEASKHINCAKPNGAKYINTGKLLKKRYSFHLKPL